LSLISVFVANYVYLLDFENCTADISNGECPPETWWLRRGGKSPGEIWLPLLQPWRNAVSSCS